jgi:hypothetical protein
MTSPAEGGTTTTFSAFTFEDPTEKLPEEVLISVCAGASIQILVQASPSVAIGGPWDLTSIREFHAEVAGPETSDSGREDMDFFLFTVEGIGKFSFECDNGAILEAAFKAAIKATAPASAVAGRKIVDRRRLSVLSAEALDTLQSLTQKVEGFARQIQEAAQVTAGASSPADVPRLQVLCGSLAQVNGSIDKLQCVGVDAVMTGPLSSGKEEAKEKRKALNRRIQVLQKNALLAYKDLEQTIESLKAGSEDGTGREAGGETNLSDERTGLNGRALSVALAEASRLKSRVAPADDESAATELSVEEEAALHAVSLYQVVMGSGPLGITFREVC